MTNFRYHIQKILSAENDPFNDRYKLIKTRTTLILVSVIITLLVANFSSAEGMKGGIMLVLIPALTAFAIKFVMDEKFALLSIFTINYFVLGVSRYISGPFGLSIDGLLILMYLILFFKNFYKGIDFKDAKNELTLLAGIWYAYAIFEILNPEAVSRVAWFYAMRGIALHMLLTIPLTFMFLNKLEHILFFIKLWAVFSILGTLKGMQQLYLGCDPFEQAWLDMGNAITHVLFGKLRVFSFFTDAGQFGASQGHAGAVFIITALGLKNRKDKWFLLIAGFLALYAMMISGTRGAISVPLGAGMLFIILSKKRSLIVIGGILMVVIFVFFKYTTIGNTVYAIKRMRTAFDPNDPSLQVRLSNQRLLKTYMATRPIGGGIGSTGGFGKQFSPGTLLAETPTDSWYVIIWTEQGVVGLTLHLFILFYILTKSSLVIMFRLKDEELKFTIMGLTCGYFGIMIAAYGNAIFGQMPTGITLYMSMAWMFMAQKIDKELEDAKKGIN